MKLCRWGRQSTVLGLPIGLILLFVACYNIYTIGQTLSLINLNMPFITLHNLGTVFSEKFDFVRNYLLIKMTTAVVWGLVTGLNLIIFRRAVWIAFITLGLGIIFFAEIIAGLSYGIYIFFQHIYIESNSEDISPPLGGLLKWPTHFWVSLTFNLVGVIVIGSLVLDVHYSFIKILQHNGNGWEKKAYYELHEPQQHTVATLVDSWDKKMGIRGKSTPELEWAMKRKQYPQQHTNETTSLIV